jgi:hypothetical protein
MCGAVRNVKTLFSICRRKPEKGALTLSPIAHLPTVFPVGSIMAFDAGVDGCAYFVAALSDLDYEAVEPG